MYYLVINYISLVKDMVMRELESSVGKVQESIKFVIGNSI